jgi:hypothetical protein
LIKNSYLEGWKRIESILADLQSILAWLLLIGCVATKVDGDRTVQTKESDLKKSETERGRR